ncbi:MAG: HAD family hydrolase [Acidimicrobiia bacterium]
MPQIDAVLLDVGGVFLLPDHDHLAAALERAGVRVDRSRLDHAHYLGVAALESFVEGDREIWQAYNHAYARACGAGDDQVAEAVEILLNEFTVAEVWTRTIPGSREALRHIADLGVKLAIVSNADGTVEDQLRADAICQVGPGAGVPVDAVLDSTVVGVAKPDPKIFEIALERVAVAPDRAIHVGDTPAADVAGARAAGIRPVLVDPYDLHTRLDVVRVPSLAEVVELVASARR